MSLQDYLAKNYLSKKEQKRQKRAKKLKEAQGPGGSRDGDKRDAVDADAVVVQTEVASARTAPAPVVRAVWNGDEIFDDPLAIFKGEDGDAAIQVQKYSANRYKIKAGPRWDGVDRSNGFERKYMQKKRHEQDTVNNRDYYDDDVADHYSD